MGLAEMMNNLPPQRQAEVIDFVEFLLGKEAQKPKRKMKCDWSGGVSELRERFSSVELQHQASQWRIEDETTH